MGHGATTKKFYKGMKREVIDPVIKKYSAPSGEIHNFPYLPLR
jgi:hypothetical protein